MGAGAGSQGGPGAEGGERGLAEPLSRGWGGCWAELQRPTPVGWREAGAPGLRRSGDPGRKREVGGRMVLRGS